MAEEATDDIPEPGTGGEFIFGELAPVDTNFRQLVTSRSPHLWNFGCVRPKTCETLYYSALADFLEAFMDDLHNQPELVSWFIFDRKIVN